MRIPLIIFPLCVCFLLGGRALAQGPPNPTIDLTILANLETIVKISEDTATIVTTAKDIFELYSAIKQSISEHTHTIEALKNNAEAIASFRVTPTRMNVKILPDNWLGSAGSASFYLDASDGLKLKADIPTREDLQRGLLTAYNTLYRWSLRDQDEASQPNDPATESVTDWTDPNKTQYDWTYGPNGEKFQLSETLVARMQHAEELHKLIRGYSVLRTTARATTSGINQDDSSETAKMNIVQQLQDSVTKDPVNPGSTEDQEGLTTADMQDNIRSMLFLILESSKQQTATAIQAAELEALQVLANSDTAHFDFALTPTRVADLAAAAREEAAGQAHISNILIAGHK